MSRENVILNPSQIIGNIKTNLIKIVKTYDDDAEINLDVQIKNKYSCILYDHEEFLEINPQDILDIEFPEPVDLEYQVIKDGTRIVRQGYLREFVEQVEEKKIENTLPLPETISEPLNNPQVQKQESIQPISPSPYQLDINKLLQQSSEANEKATERIERVLSQLMNQNSNGNHSFNHQEQVNALLERQIQDLKETIREQKTEISNLNKELSDARIENLKLSVVAAQAQATNSNTVNPEAKIDEYIKGYERTQKRFQDQLEEKKKELDDINAKIIENRILATIKNSGKENNTEVDKAFADILRSKAPAIIERGFDYIFPLNPINNTNATNQAATPAII